MIAWDRVAELKDEIGAESFSDVVEIFLEEVDEVVARMWARPDPDTLAGDLHFLKGSALNLGFAAFGARCLAAERRAAAEGPDAIDTAPVLDCYANSRRVFLETLQEEVV